MLEFKTNIPPDSAKKLAKLLHSEGYSSWEEVHADGSRAIGKIPMIGDKFIGFITDELVERKIIFPQW
jgi:hypothetical protein